MVNLHNCRHVHNAIVAQLVLKTYGNKIQYPSHSHIKLNIQEINVATNKNIHLPELLMSIISYPFHVNKTYSCS